MVYKLFYWPTPNGKKVSILLEELGIKYQLIPVNIGKGDQFTDDFLKINPNHRMPALVDTEPADGGPPLSVFESGAMLEYIADKEGRFLPKDPRKRAEVMQWVFWQMANQGPKLGECGHFRRLGDTKGDQSYAVTRFSDEANRIYGVLNNVLHSRRYIAGDEYTIADIICFPWCAGIEMQGQNIDEFPYFKRWHTELSQREAVKKGMDAGKEFAEDYTKLSQEEKDRRAKMLYNQRARPAPEGGML